MKTVVALVLDPAFALMNSKTFLVKNEKIYPVKFLKYTGRDPMDPFH